MHAEPQHADALPDAWTRNGLHSADWEALPPKARVAYVLSSMLGFGIPATGAALVLGFVFHDHDTWVIAALIAGWLLVLALAATHGHVRHRRTRFVLDEVGLRIRRGLWWRSETLVPRSRVQHLDLERGPIERMLGLASLVVHTAGTRMNAVRLAGMGAMRGREVRNDLIDRDGDDDDAV
jgi:uncharacterized protein